MGGQSYVNYDKTSNFGNFSGQATTEGGGGFNLLNKNGEYSYDLSEYTGIVLDIASKEARTFGFCLEDSTWRIPSWIFWQATFEVKGGMN